MNPVWIVVGGVAVLMFLRSGAATLLGINMGAAPGAPVIGAPRLPPRVAPGSASIVVSASQPGGAPPALNPNVAGPSIAPVSHAPIPSYSTAPSYSAPAAQVTTQPVAQPQPYSAPAPIPSPIFTTQPVDQPIQGPGVVTYPDASIDTTTPVASAGFTDTGSSDATPTFADDNNIAQQV